MGRIVIGNLPDNISEAEIREALKEYAPIEKISLIKESDAPTAIIETDATHAYATALAQRINGRLYHGRALTAWAPTMGWE
jgi:RNA recognition motif-containing protein